MDLAMALAEQSRRRPRGRQRPGRRPVRRRRHRGRTAGGCSAATRSARCSPRTCSSRASRASTPPRSSRRPCSGGWPPTAGQPYAETLTGFKWIGRVEGLAFGYEEALGYCVDPEHVRDKDGVSALLLLCELAAEAKAEGRTLDDLLDDIAREHGLHATDQVSVRVTDLGRDRRARWSGCARTPPDVARRARGRAGRRPQRGLRRPAARPTACATGSPRARRVIVRPERHRAEDQVLPRGGRAGATPRTASTPPGSPPPAGSTRWATTSARPPGSEDVASRTPSPGRTRRPPSWSRSSARRRRGSRRPPRGRRGRGRPRPRPSTAEAQPAEKVSGSLPSIASRSSVGGLDHRGVRRVVDPGEAPAAERDRRPVAVVLQHDARAAAARARRRRPRA